MEIKPKTRCSVGKLIKICPGKRHAWFESNFGPVRKPITVDANYATIVPK